VDRGKPDLEEDLKYLRKGTGLTPDRLANASSVIEMLGGRGLPLDTLYQRFLAAIHSLRDIPNSAALSAAYGIDGIAADDLRDRREAYSRLVARSPDTVRDWEDRVIDILALRLLTRFYAGAPTPADFPVPHGGYLIRDLNIECTIKDRRFVASRQTRTVVALAGGAQTFDYGTYSPTELSDITHAELDVTRQVPGGTVHRLRFPVPLVIGDLHTFSFRERLLDPATADDDPPTQDRSGQTFESPALRYTVLVRFVGDVPAVVWAYDKLSRIIRPGEPEEGITLAVSDDGTVSAEFLECYGGLASGVAWRW
jgi:hypothetical protein